MWSGSWWSDSIGVLHVHPGKLDVFCDIWLIKRVWETSQSRLLFLKKHKQKKKFDCMLGLGFVKGQDSGWVHIYGENFTNESINKHCVSRGRAGVHSFFLKGVLKENRLATAALDVMQLIISQNTNPHFIFMFLNWVSRVSEFPSKCQTAGGGFPKIWRFLIKVCGELRVTCRTILHSSACSKYGKQCVLCAVSLGRPIISLQPAGADLHMGCRTRPSLCALLWRGTRCVLDPGECCMLPQHI